MFDDELHLKDACKGEAGNGRRDGALGGDDDDGGEGDRDQAQAVHPPHEPALRQAEESVSCHRLVEVGVEALFENLLLPKTTDDADACHGRGYVVDHRRLHDVVQLLGLQDARVHGEVEQDKGDKDDGKPNQELGEKNTDKDDLRKYSFMKLYLWTVVLVTCEMFIREY